MGYLLKNEKNEFQASNWDWRPLLKLAEKYGWTPMKTLPPKGYTKTWNGNYWWNNSQTVIEEDALSLAKALEVALAHLPQKEMGIRPGHVSNPESVKQFYKQTPETIFSGNSGRTFVKEFIDFCKKGSFQIH